MTRAIDRVLRAATIWVPNWYLANHRVAHWDIFGWPAKKPDYGFTPETTWWFDRERGRRRSAWPARIAMGAYILRRILLMIPTMIGIMAISFAVVQFAPGGPVERVIAQLQGTDVSATARIAGGGGDFAGVAANSPAGRRRRSPRNIAARRGSTRNSSRSSRSSSASTSRRSSASA